MGGTKRKEMELTAPESVYSPPASAVIASPDRPLTTKPTGLRRQVSDSDSSSQSSGSEKNSPAPAAKKRAVVRPAPAAIAADSGSDSASDSSASPARPSAGGGKRLGGGRLRKAGAAAPKPAPAPRAAIDSDSSSSDSDSERGRPTAPAAGRAKRVAPRAAPAAAVRGSPAGSNAGSGSSSSSESDEDAGFKRVTKAQAAARLRAAAQAKRRAAALQRKQEQEGGESESDADHGGDGSAPSSPAAGGGAGAGRMVDFPASAKDAVYPPIRGDAKAVDYRGDWHVHSDSDSGALLSAKLRRPGATPQDVKFFQLQLLRRDALQSFAPGAPAGGSAGKGGKGKKGGAAAKREVLPAFLLVSRWGRVGSSNPGSAATDYASESEATAAFYRMYSDKTGGHAFGSAERWASTADGAYQPAEAGEEAGVGSGNAVTVNDQTTAPAPVPRGARDAAKGGAAAAAAAPAPAPKRDPAAILAAARGALALPPPLASTPAPRLPQSVAALLESHLASPASLIEGLGAVGADPVRLGPQLGTLPVTAFDIAARALRKLATAIGGGSGGGGGVSRLTAQLTSDLHAQISLALPAGADEPPTIATRGALIAATRTVEGVWRLNEAARLLRSARAAVPRLLPQMHPLDIAYLQALAASGAALAPLPAPSSSSFAPPGGCEAADIASMLRGTNDITCGPFASIECSAAFELRSLLAAEAFAGCVATHAGSPSASSGASSSSASPQSASRRQMVWYAGGPSSAGLEALSCGGMLRAPPAELPAAGFPFGRGLAFTPVASHALAVAQGWANAQGDPTSAPAGDSARSSSGEAVLLLCEVVIPGREHRVTKRNALTAPPAGCGAVRVVGRSFPNPANVGFWSYNDPSHATRAAARGGLMAAAAAAGVNATDLESASRADDAAAAAAPTPRVCFGSVLLADEADEGDVRAAYGDTVSGDRSVPASEVLSSESAYDGLVIFDPAQVRVRYVVRVAWAAKGSEAAADSASLQEAAPESNYSAPAPASLGPASLQRALGESNYSVPERAASASLGNVAAESNYSAAAAPESNYSAAAAVPAPSSSSAMDDASDLPESMASHSNATAAAATLEAAPSDIDTAAPRPADAGPVSQSEFDTGAPAIESVYDLDDVMGQY